MSNLQIQNQKLILDFCQNQYKTIFAKQYDKDSRYIPIQCTNNGEIYPIDPSFTVQIEMLTPDNRAILENVPIQSDGSLLVELTESMLFYPGKGEATIRIFDKAHGKLLSTVNFYIIIGKNPYSDDRIIDSDEFNALVELYKQAAHDYTNIITESKANADAAKLSADNTKESEANASNSAKSAKASASNAKDSESKAFVSEQSALNYSQLAERFTIQAKSYAHGGTATRENEDVDNARYYYEQTKQISVGLNGVLLPMGTISFSSLNSQTKQPGYMYNISGSFVSDSTFKDGGGHTYPQGTNVYCTADGYWDCLAGVQSEEIVSSIEPTSQNIGMFWLQPY